MSQTPADPRLYTPGAVAIATVMGSLLAGVLLVVLNYVALDRRDLAIRSVVMGVVVYVLLTGVAFLLPTSATLGALLMVAHPAIAYFGARFLQGQIVRYHAAQGGALQSPFKALGIGFIVGVVIAVLFMPFVLAPSLSTT